MAIDTTTQTTQSNTSAKAASIPTLKTVMTSLEENAEALKAFDIESLALFGSVARGEATPSSDLDFLVEFEGPATFDGYMGLNFFWKS